jgi:hypothetical protein
MTKSNVVSIRRLDISTMYSFKFTVRNISEDKVCEMELPSEFRFLPKIEKEMITSLLMSYFLSAEIFVKSQVAKETNDLGFIPKELIGESVSLSICKNKLTGFTFEHSVPETIKGNAGEIAIANSITELLMDYEESLSNSSEDNNIILS